MSPKKGPFHKEKLVFQAFFSENLLVFWREYGIIDISDMSLGLCVCSVRMLDTNVK